MAEAGGGGGGGGRRGRAEDGESASILTAYGAGRAGQAVLKPTAGNLRRFAETPVARRAINVVKDKIACMDWQVKVRRGVCRSGDSGCGGEDGGAAVCARGAERGGIASGRCSSR